MSRTHKEVQNLLNRSFEEQLTPAEQIRLDQALRNSSELRREKDLIQQLFSLGRQYNDQSFQPHFADRVMNRIEKARDGVPASGFGDSLLSYFYRVAAVTIVLIIGVSAYNLTDDDVVTGGTTFGYVEATFDDIVQTDLNNVLEN